MFGSREINKKKKKKIQISMNEFKLKLNQIYLLESVFFSHHNLFLLNGAHIFMTNQEPTILYQFQLHAKNTFPQKSHCTLCTIVNSIIISCIAPPSPRF
jgi:hypothetical protein